MGYYKANDVILRRIYSYCIDNVILYIGSSTCSLYGLEKNHREAFAKWPNEKGKQKKFRRALQDKIKHGSFKTVLEKICTQHEIEDLEGQLIRYFKPEYNIDYDPVASSKRRRDY